MSSIWRKYHGALIPWKPPHLDIGLTRNEIKQAIEDQVADDQDQDQGILDVDFLEFNELEQDALEDSKEDLEFSELDIDLCSFCYYFI